jgi:hypothetical protein
MSPFSPLATATSYYNFSNGNAGWMQILKLQSTGVHSDGYYGPNITYKDISTDVLSNSTNNVQEFGSLALTATGNAFAVVRRTGNKDGIVNWQLQDDTVSWRLIGNVALDNGTWA